MLAVCGAAICVSCSAFEPLFGGGLRIEWEVNEIVLIPPVVADSLVITLSEQGRLQARNRYTGSPVWGRQLAGASLPLQMVLQDALLLVPAVLLYAIDVRTGQIVWVERGADDAAGIVSPVVSGDTVFAAGYTGQDAMALDLESGQLLWRAQLGKTVFRPTVTPSLVVYPIRSVRELDELVALDRNTGAEQWRLTFPDSLGFAGGTTDAGALVGDRLIVGTKIAEIMAIRIADGSVIWRRYTGTAQSGGGYGYPPLVVDSGVVLYRGDGRLESFDPETGNVLWSSAVGNIATEGPRECAPYLCLGNGRVYIIDRRGEVVWAYGGGRSGAVFLSNVTAANDGWMYAGIETLSNEGRLIAFKSPVAVGATP